MRLVRAERNHFVRRLVSGAGVFVLSAISLMAADWPQFRGNPSLTGISPEKLPDKPSLLWTFKTGGQVKSSPAIVGGKVFVGSHDSNLVALALSDGKKLWSYPAGEQI